jgi:hypothetical protein
MALGKVREQLQAASAETDNFVLAGDVKLDTARQLNMRYRRRCLMLAHYTAVAEANMRYLETGITYRSQGRQVREEGKAREHESVLDHMCGSKDFVATVNVINDSTTDHHPLLASVMIHTLLQANKSIVRRNFKKVTSTTLSLERLNPGTGTGLTFSGSSTWTLSSSSSTRGLFTAWTWLPLSRGSRSRMGHSPYTSGTTLWRSWLVGNCLAVAPSTSLSGTE